MGNDTRKSDLLYVNNKGADQPVQMCSLISACFIHFLVSTVKPVLSGHSKIDKTKVLMTNGSLMKVESIAECPLEHSAILLPCIRQYLVMKNDFWLFYVCLLIRQVLL